MANLKVPVHMRLDPVLVAAVDTEAEARTQAVGRKVNRTEMIEELLARALQRSPRPAGATATPAARVGGCRHPKAKLTVFSWGTMCECGARIR